MEWIFYSNVRGLYLSWRIQARILPEWHKSISIYTYIQVHIWIYVHIQGRERECVCVCYARPIFLNPLTFLHAMQCIHVYRNNTSFSTLISIISQIHIFFQFINSVSIIHTCIYFMYVDHQYHFYTTFSQLGLIMHSIPLLKLPVYEWLDNRLTFLCLPTSIFYFNPYGRYNFHRNLD